MGGPGAVNNCAIVVQGVVATPFGWLDSATVSGSTLTASGWAIDPSVASSPIQVELSVDGTVVARGSANRPKPGLGAAMSVDAPGAGDDHAFVLTSTLSVGTHTVCVSAIDAESGSGARLRYGGPGASNNCAAVTVSRAPFGWMDTVTISGSVVTAKGWTVDPDTASTPVEVTLVVDGVSAATATANETKPGLGAAIAADAPGSGDKHAFTLSATLSGGAHTVCVVATNTGSGPPGALRYEGEGAASNCRAVTVRTTEASPFGWMDAATLSGSVVTARGWAVDPDSPSAPVQVQLVVNGNVAVTATANGSKPGLGAAIAAEAPGAGDNHAYSLSTTLAVGTHRICVIAIDDGGGTSPTLRYGGPGALNNCATVTYGINAPIGWMDSASLSGADLNVTGWSIDPDVAAAAVEVQLTVNGSVVATGAADVPKPGLGEAVAADAPGAGDNHGYGLATVLSVGTHVVCVVALDNAGGPGSRLLYGGPGASDNCATVVVSKAPFGWLDSASLSLTGGVVTAKGWAIDPDVPTTPITVRLVVDGTVVATGTANGARPGLAAAVLPGAGDSHGYALEAALTPGAHTVCVVGVNNAPGPDTTLSYGGPGAVANCATVSYSP